MKNRNYQSALNRSGTKDVAIATSKYAPCDVFLRVNAGAKF